MAPTALNCFSYMRVDWYFRGCAADFSLLNLPKGKSLSRSKPATSSYAQAPQHTVWDDDVKSCNTMKDLLL